LAKGGGKKLVVRPVKVVDGGKRKKGKRSLGKKRRRGYTSAPKRQFFIKTGRQKKRAETNLLDKEGNKTQCDGRKKDADHPNTGRPKEGPATRGEGRKKKGLPIPSKKGKRPSCSGQAAARKRKKKKGHQTQPRGREGETPALWKGEDEGSCTGDHI